MHDAPGTDGTTSGGDPVETAFIEGFRSAADKQAFLRLAGIPFDLSIMGQPGLKLVAVRIEEDWRVGAVSPSFGTAELSYQPLPATMIIGGAKVVLEYVSSTERRLFSWSQVIREH